MRLDVSKMVNRLTSHPFATGLIARWQYFGVEPFAEFCNFFDRVLVVFRTAVAFCVFPIVPRERVNRGSSAPIQFGVILLERLAILDP